MHQRMAWKFFKCAARKYRAFFQKLAANRLYPSWHMPRCQWHPSRRRFVDNWVDTAGRFLLTVRRKINSYKKILPLSDTKIHIWICTGLDIKNIFARTTGASIAKAGRVQEKDWNFAYKLRVLDFCFDFSKKAGSSYTNIVIELVCDHEAFALKHLRHCQYVPAPQCLQNDL